MPLLDVQVTVSGNPAAGASVTLYYDSGSGRFVAGEGTTDATGNVTFNNLAAGAYDGTASVNGLYASGGTSLATGASGTLDLSLMGTGAVAGQITDLAGDLNGPQSLNLLRPRVAVLNLYLFQRVKR